MRKDSARERNPYIDIVKAAAIIAVVLGHCVQYGSGGSFLDSGAFFDNVLFKIIYSWHMPLFMLVSGYLFAFSVERAKWQEVLRKKTASLVIPVFLWAILPFSVSVAKLFMEHEKLSTLGFVTKYLSTALGNLWFLWAVFWCSLIVIVVKTFFADSIWLYLLGFGMTFFVPDFRDLHLYKFMYPYFVAGYFFNKRGYAVRLRKYYEKPFAVFLSGLLFALLLPFYTHDTYIYNTGYFILNGDPTRQVCIDLYRFIIGIVGSIFFLLLLYQLSHIGCIRSKLEGILCLVGVNCMGIYIISSYIFSYVLKRAAYGLPGINYFITSVEAVIVLSVSLWGSCIIKKNQRLNKWLLGGRQ